MPAEIADHMVSLIQFQEFIPVSHHKAIGKKIPKTQPPVEDKQQNNQSRHPQISAKIGNNLEEAIKEWSSSRLQESNNLNFKVHMSIVANFSNKSKKNQKKFNKQQKKQSPAFILTLLPTFQISYHNKQNVLRQHLGHCCKPYI